MHKGFHYKNTEIKHHNGKKTIRKVCIKNGKGYKSVCRYHKGKCCGTVKKNLLPHHIDKIYGGEFIPGLFSDCSMQTKKTRKNRK
jgi:hypothetical protein